MMAKTKIEWTDATWNPITGCSPVSEGCENCYARQMATRLQANSRTAEKYRNVFKPTFHEEELDNLKERFGKCDRVFVGSMGDLFHDDFSDEQIFRIFDTLRGVRNNKNNYIVFQLLTKRIERAAIVLAKYEMYLRHTFQCFNSEEEFSQLFDLYNIWLGVTVENYEQEERILNLRNSNIIKKKFVSFEPLLNFGLILPFDLDDIEEIDWVIVGGETGNRARPMKKEWVDEIFNSCQSFKIPFFFKKWGSSKLSYRDDDNHDDIYCGRQWHEFPE